MFRRRLGKGGNSGRRIRRLAGENRAAQTREKSALALQAGGRPVKRWVNPVLNLIVREGARVSGCSSRQVIRSSKM